MTPSGDVTNTDLILVAMALAGAADDFADIEDIAVHAHALSPQRFGWRTRNFPSDKITVQAIADLEARHQDRYTLRGGEKVASRRLTAEGRKASLRAAAKIAGAELADVGAMIAHFSAQNRTTATPIRAERRPVQAELAELRRHKVYRAWSDGRDIREIDRWLAYDALSCLPDAPDSTVRDQLEKLTRLAEQWNDEEVLQFLPALSEATAPIGNPNRGN
jgi:hypothetical protein